MKKSSWIPFLLAALFSGFGLPAAAQEAAPRTFEVQHVRQVCYPYLQHVTETSFTVIWTTNIDALAWVEVAPDDGTHFYNCERPKYYDLRGLGRRPIGRVHKVTVSGLEPGTTYRYRIMMQGVLDQDNRRSIVYGEGYGLDLRKHPTKVTTKRAAYDKLEFAVVNDMHEHDSVLRADFKDAKGKYDFVVFNGDMTSAIDHEEDVVKHYLSSAGELFASDTPLYIVRGNHEYRGNDALKWYDYMDTPTGKTYYAFRYGGFFFIALDSGEDKPDSDIRNLGVMAVEPYVREEAAWLKEVVASEAFRTADARIVFSHMSPNPKGWHGDRMVAELFVPTLNEAGIDLMLCAHHHVHRIEPAGTTNAAFPVVINDNQTLLECTLDRKEVRLRFHDDTQKVWKTVSYPVGTFKKKQ